MPEIPAILLVDDNADDVALTQRALKQSNIANRVIVAVDGVEALAYLEGSDALPQVVLLDIKMPRLNGLETLKRLRASPRTRHLPVVMLTASDEERDLLASYELGVNSYVRKPVDFTEFADAARSLGLYWLLLNRAPRPVPDP